jgi:hypothetical protein
VPEQKIKTKPTDLSRSDTQGLKKCCVSDEMNGMEDEEKAGNVGHEYERMSCEHKVKNGNCGGTEAETDEGYGEYSETGEVGKRLVTPRRKLT